MKLHCSTATVRVVLVAWLLLVFAVPAWSQEEELGFAQEGGFVGVSFLPDFTFDGVTFDGETIYKEVDGDEIVILPRLDVRNLVRFALGYRGRQASIEVSYDRTSHNGTFLDSPPDSAFSRTCSSAARCPGSR
jgi:hypothetical protein